MRILFFMWHANNENILINHLKQMNHEVTIFSEKCSNYLVDEQFEKSLKNAITSHCIDSVLSFNYFPIISKVCMATEATYYSWVYDSPLLTLYAKEVGLPCNRIGIFDSSLVDDLKKKNIHTIFHLPLAVDISFFKEKIRSIAPQNNYISDISFVGSLYNGQNNYYNQLEVPDLVKRASSEIIDSLLFSNKKLTFENAFSNNDIPLRDFLSYHWANALASSGMLLDNDFSITSNELVSTQIFDKKIAERERIELLQDIASTFNSFSLFTGSDIRDYPKLTLCNKGIVNYECDMPLIFNNSKINLNITARAIRSGIPLRVLDVIACRGFVLSNLQDELLDYFKIGESIEVFESPEECKEKIRFYLSHESERKKIVAEGNRIVQEAFNYPRLLNILFNA